MNSKILVTTAALAATAVLLAGCASTEKEKKEEAAAQTMKVNCATAEGDIRMLQGEKASAAQMAADGVTAIVPVGAVVGVASGTEGTKAQIATGEYNRVLDQKIAQIKSPCHIP